MTWGLYFVALGSAGYVLSPIYRGLTIQFKVFVQMSGMTLGGGIEADRRLRLFEREKRAEKRRTMQRMRAEEMDRDGEVLDK